MNPSPEANFMVGYIVSTWPRLSETFILNEIIAMERSGVSLRIFSLKDPKQEPVHGKVAQVRARVTYLSLLPHWKEALAGNLQGFWRQPGCYSRTLLQAITQAIRHRRLAAVRHFLKAARLAEIVFREPVGHLHAHFATAPALVAMFTHQLTGIPYTFTGHAKDIYLTPADRLRPKALRAKAVITCTEYNRQYLSSQLGPELNGKLHCIYHGLDLSEFKFRWPPPPDPQGALILSVARLVEKKGLSDLVDAAAILRQRGRRFRVEIIGDGPLRQALEAQVAGLDLNNLVRLLGPLSHEATRLVYHQAAIFALPCIIAANGDRDGIPNVLLEAMASGVPVVSTAVSGIPELIESEREGLLIPPNRPDLLAEAVDRLLASRESAERFARAAHAKLQTRFSLDSNSARLLVLFRRIAAENPPSRLAADSAAGDPRLWSARQ